MNHILRYSHPAVEFKNGLPIGKGLGTSASR